MIYTIWLEILAVENVCTSSAWYIDWHLKLLRRGRPGCSRWVLFRMIDWNLKLLRSRRAGCSRWITMHTYSSYHCLNNTEWRPVADPEGGAWSARPPVWAIIHLYTAVYERKTAHLRIEAGIYTENEIVPSITSSYHTVCMPPFIRLYHFLVCWCSLSVDHAPLSPLSWIRHWRR